MRDTYRTVPYRQGMTCSQWKQHRSDVENCRISIPVCVEEKPARRPKLLIGLVLFATAIAAGLAASYAVGSDPPNRRPTDRERILRALRTRQPIKPAETYCCGTVATDPRPALQEAPTTTVLIRDTTVNRGAGGAVIDLAIMGGEAFAGGDFSIQICRPGTDLREPGDPSQDAQKVRIKEIRFGNRSVWRFGNPSRPQFVSPTVTEPLPSPRTSITFGHSPRPGRGPDPTAPKGAGLRVGEGLLAELVVEVDDDASGVFPVRVNYQGFSNVWTVGINPGTGLPGGVRIPTIWADGKIAVFDPQNYLAPEEIAALVKRTAEALQAAGR